MKQALAFSRFHDHIQAQAANRFLRFLRQVRIRDDAFELLQRSNPAQRAAAELGVVRYGLNRKENPINPAEMIRLVGHTDMSMICRVYYHADLQKVSDKMESFKIVGTAPEKYGEVKPGV